MDNEAQHAAVREPWMPSVAFISSYAGPGGSEIYLKRLLAHIDRPLVDRVVLLGEGPLQDGLLALGYPVDVIPTAGSASSLLASSQRLRRRLRSHRPDVVHANGLKAAIVAVFATAGTRVPVVWVRHDFSFEGWRARALARMCREVICVSGSLATTFRGGLTHKVTVVHTGMPPVEVDREKAHVLATEILAAPDGKPIIALVGQLVPGKGHRELVDITADLVVRLPRARIAFIGGLPSPRSASYLEGLKARVDARGVGEVVRFLGHRDDAVSLVAGSDIVVMPSISPYKGTRRKGSLSWLWRPWRSERRSSPIGLEACPSGGWMRVDRGARRQERLWTRSSVSRLIRCFGTSSRSAVEPCANSILDGQHGEGLQRAYRRAARR